jgi:hypothetical protein
MGIPCEVEYVYYPADMGYPDYPDTPAEVEILSVKVTAMKFGVPTEFNITNDLPSELLDELTEQIIDSNTEEY